MNSADLVAKYRFAPDRPLTMPTEGKSIQVAWDDFLVLADRIEALEAWKAEAMEVLREIGNTVEYYDGTGLLQYRPKLSAEQAQSLAFRAARRLVEKEDGRHG